MSVCDNCFFFFFKQKTAYELRISDWSSDVCSSDLRQAAPDPRRDPRRPRQRQADRQDHRRGGGQICLCGEMDRIERRIMSYALSFSATDPAELWAEAGDAAAALVAGERDGIANMANVAALIWQAVPDLNWAGFYRFDGPDLVLGPFQEIGKASCGGKGG